MIIKKAPVRSGAFLIDLTYKKLLSKDIADK